MTNTATTTNADITSTTACGAQPHPCQTRIEIFSDGSCLGNPGPGGWGAVILRKNAVGQNVKTLERSGHEVNETKNIRMEMTAAACALESLGRVTAEPITLYCDANLIPNSMNRDLAKWKAKGWKKSDGRPVNNQDLWERLERAAQGRNVNWSWVRGHNGTEHNERADKLSRAASRKAEKIIMGR